MAGSDLSGIGVMRPQPEQPSGVQVLKFTGPGEGVAVFLQQNCQVVLANASQLLVDVLIVSSIELQQKGGCG